MFAELDENYKLFFKHYERTWTLISNFEKKLERESRDRSTRNPSEAQLNKIKSQLDHFLRDMLNDREWLLRCKYVIPLNVIKSYDSSDALLESAILSHCSTILRFIDLIQTDSTPQFIITSHIFDQLTEATLKSQRTNSSQINYETSPTLTARGITKMILNWKSTKKKRIN